MSSDSDSDICDFTSSVSKQMSKSKSFNQFWQNYKKRSNEIVESNDTTQELDKENLNSTSMHDQITTCNITSKQDEVKVITAPTEETNTPIEMANRLERLTEEVEFILEDNRRRKGRGRGRRLGRGRGFVWLPKRKRATRRNLRAPVSVVLSSDDETQPTKASNTNESPNNKTNQEVNPIVTVNILWKSVQKNSFKLPKYHPLNCIISHYLEKYNVNPKLLLFTLDDKQINLENSSYVSLRLDDSKVIEGGILPESYLEEQPKNTPITNSSGSELQFKVQCSDRRNKEIDVKCKRTDRMEIIFWQVLNVLKEPIENVKLYFDGRLLHPHSQLADLDLEEGDCFDLILTK